MFAKEITASYIHRTKEIHFTGHNIITHAIASMGLV